MTPDDCQDSAAALRAAYVRAGRMLLVLAAFHLGHSVSVASIGYTHGNFEAVDAVIGFSIIVVLLAFVIWVAVGVRRGRRIMAGTGVTVFFVMGWIIAMASAVAYNAPFPAWLVVFEIVYFCVALLAAATMIRTLFRHETAKPPSSGS